MDGNGNCDQERSVCALEEMDFMFSPDRQRVIRRLLNNIERQLFE